MEPGIVYVVFNRWIRDPETNEMPYKIGITRNSVYDRYYGLGLKMPGKFEALFAYQFDDCRKAEQLIHGVLDKFCANGEWFTIRQKELDLVKEICNVMGGVLVTDEVANEIETETQAKESIEPVEIKAVASPTAESRIVTPRDVIRSGTPINPGRPCRIFVFPIQNAITEGKDIYDSTRGCWRITEKYRDVSVYEFAVGLQNGVSVGAYRIKQWSSVPEEDNKGRFDGEEIAEFNGFTWHRQIDPVKGYWGYGNHLVVEFDGRGKFQLIRPEKKLWYDCV